MLGGDSTRNATGSIFYLRISSKYAVPRIPPIPLKSPNAKPDPADPLLAGSAKRVGR